MMNNLDSAAIQLAEQGRVADLAALSRWILHEQERLVIMVSAGLSRDEAKGIMLQGDQQQKGGMQ